MWYLLLLIPAAILVFLLVIVLRAINFKPLPQPEISEEEQLFDREKSVENLAKLIKCKTVSYRDPEMEDDGEFKKLIDLLPFLKDSGMFDF